jgi:hypothetical protein
MEENNKPKKKVGSKLWDPLLNAFQNSLNFHNQTYSCFPLGRQQSRLPKAMESLFKPSPPGLYASHDAIYTSTALFGIFIIHLGPFKVVRYAGYSKAVR